MCLNCPDCSGADEEMGAKECACSDYMGCNNTLIGGYGGLFTGMCFATEYQGEATPHGHGFWSVANMYQHHTLEEIGILVEENFKKMYARKRHTTP